MNGKSLLAKLLGTASLSVAATAVAAGAPELSAEQTEAGNSEMERLVAAAYGEGETAGVTAEQARWGAVLSDPAAADNMGLAITLLSTTANTPEQIQAAMAANGPRTAAATTGTAAAIQGQGQMATANQPTAADPLKAVSDPIASQTPLVDLGTGGGGEAKDAADPAVAAGLWDTALAREASTITAGGFALAGYQPAAR